MRRGARSDIRTQQPAVSWRLGFVGAGRVGTALAWQCARHGFEVAGLVDSSSRRQHAANQSLGLSHGSLTPGALAGLCDVMFLTVPDRVVAALFLRLRPRLRPGMLVVHCAGAYGVEVFESARGLGIETLALHPAMSFADPARARIRLSGCQFAVDGTKVGIGFAREFARRLGGGCVVVKGDDRPLYHAMCVFATNFQNALRDSAEQLAAELGLPRTRASMMLDKLMGGALEDMLGHGSISVTGPVQRGDAPTVAANLRALRARAPDLVPVYVALSRRLLQTARPQAARAINEVLDAE